MVKRVLVVGGHGFLGTHIVERLKSSGHEPVALSRRDGLDLLRPEPICAVLRDVMPDIILNCAAHVGSVHYVSDHAGDVFHDNTLMALNLYRAAVELAPTAIVVNPLSNCSYPGEASIHNEPDWWKGAVHPSVMSYGNAKRFIYVLSACHYRQSGLRTLNFLVPNSFGPGDYTDPNRTHALNGMIIRMILAKRNGDTEFVVWGTGKPVREWGYIKDMAAILVAALGLPWRTVEPVNIAQNHGWSIGDSARAVAAAVRFEGKLVFDTKYQDGAMRKVLDDRAFRQVFPHFHFTDHAQGIRETVKYYSQVLPR